jgi:hypothetical protein
LASDKDVILARLNDLPAWVWNSSSMKWIIEKGSVVEMNN